MRNFTNWTSMELAELLVDNEVYENVETALLTDRSDLIKEAKSQDEDSKNVTILMTDDDKGLWSIYEESGQALEHDFDSEDEAVEFAEDQGWKRVETFNK